MNKYSLFLLIFLFLGACKNSKDIATATGAKMTSKQLQKNMELADFTFSFFQGKARVNFNDGNINQSFTANIRIKDKQTIWMSLTGPFGIEGARILLTKNRIQIIDRLNGVYYDEPFEFINNYLPFSADLNLIQNIIVGNSFSEEWTKQKVALVDGYYEVEDAFAGINASYTIKPSYKYHSVNLEESNPSRKVNLSFGDYRYVEDLLFAMMREIEFIEADKEVHVELNFSKVKKEKQLDFPFDIPERMKTKKQ